MLDIEDVEVDPVNRQFGDTPLHSAVKFSINEPELGAYLGKSFIDLSFVFSTDLTTFLLFLQLRC